MKKEIIIDRIEFIVSYAPNMQSLKENSPEEYPFLIDVKVFAKTKRMKKFTYCSISYLFGGIPTFSGLYSDSLRAEHLTKEMLKTKSVLKYYDLSCFEVPEELKDAGKIAARKHYLKLFNECKE